MRAARGSSSSTRLVLLAGAAVVLACLAVRSPTRRIGDGPEYVAMALQLSHLERPSLSAPETASTLAYFAEIEGGFGVFTESLWAESPIRYGAARLLAFATRPARGAPLL